MSLEGFPADFDDTQEMVCTQCGATPLWAEFRDGRWILVDGEGRAHAPHCPGEPFPNKGYN